MTRVSVCMATYNGAAWVGEQVASVLAQLTDDDELVVVDDASSDGTLDVLRAVDDPRVRVEAAERNSGYVATFGRALASARGRYLLLADQDDVWVPGRLEAMVAALGDHDVVASNLETLDGRPLRGPYGQERWVLRASDSRRHVRNVLAVLAGNRPYYGCAMGLRREVLAGATPFPAYLRESHDLWLGLYGNVTRSIVHLDLVTVRRRLHDDNASTERPRGVREVLASRALLVRCVVDVLRRARRR